MNPSFNSAQKKALSMNKGPKESGTTLKKRQEEDAEKMREKNRLAVEKRQKEEEEKARLAREGK
ncbi:BZ3500_MvSof-1268-A1-R1_Chr1-1g00821 [Microbotryum saponariae]|uniref:BZ3500_MvSof-1268-A1-R1_Chr1-1g00821 protein n=1 Tax=Microbotryum saponariae TaxID=289078 RepID=A0A2X0L065_9BASI|nr:BZ3500_MvSof-1268-A1-R1_Chr1-1g00821 [Microbotryum saponariae]SCZ92743.1 BZ3501_MvSof-1269-A2-R1_Chr1-1g00418 [Microbotryum saponariae]